MCVQRASAMKTCFDPQPLGISRVMTSARVVTDKYLDALQSRGHDVAVDLQEMTSARRLFVDGTGREASVESDHHQQLQQQQRQQRPTSTQYISDTCVLLTYFTGDVESNVDQHFARALGGGRPNSFGGPNFHGATPPSLHSGVSTHSGAWFGKPVLKSSRSCYSDHTNSPLISQVNKPQTTFVHSSCGFHITNQARTHKHTDRTDYNTLRRKLARSVIKLGRSDFGATENKQRAHLLL